MRSPVPIPSEHTDTLCSYLIEGELCFICICDRSYPRKLAFTYLSDLSREFTTTYQPQQYLAPTCRPYAFVEFDTFIQRTKKTYQDSRATQNLDKLNDELKDVTKVMTKNIEDLLYRGDSLERMGDISSRLREDSRKYKKAAVRINWELLLKQVSTGQVASWLRCAQRLTRNSMAPLEVWPSSSSSSYGGVSSERSLRAIWHRQCPQLPFCSVFWLSRRWRRSIAVVSCCDDGALFPEYSLSVRRPVQSAPCCHD